jgi:hypothetical protein
MGVTSCSGWMPQFPSKIAPPFVPRTQSLVRFEWLAERITMQELEAALSLCNNTAPGADALGEKTILATYF